MAKRQYASARLLSRIVMALFAAIAVWSIPVIRNELGNAGSSRVIDQVNAALNLAVIVLFLFWWYRCYSNIPALGARFSRHLPAWAVGFYFIPIYHLVRPYQCAQEMWRTAAPDGQPPQTSGLILAWWLVWIGRDAVYIVWHSQAIRHAVHGVAALLALLVVRAITARQEAKSVEVPAGVFD